MLAQVSDRDLELARRLPDDLAEGGSGSAAHRLIELVCENWVSLTRVVERQDVWMLESGRDLDLAQEPLGPQYCGQLRTEYLESYLPMMLEVLGEIDGSHAAAAKLSLDLVAVG